MSRIGIGFDAHKFLPGQKLIIGGVEIPFELGLEGYSDADVLTHAICDAVLGAVGERDIGSHFSDTDPRYKGISSLVLLREVLTLSYSKGFRVENIDTVVVCEKPMISGYVSQIKRKLASVIGFPDESLSIKATTTDGMGFTGRGEGIAAYAVVLMKNMD